MKLMLGPGAEHEDPGESEIREAIHALPGGHDSFAILSRDEEHYVQAAGGGAEGFILEFRAGGWEHHFRCLDTRLSAERVCEAFVEYARSGERPAAFQWEAAEGPPQSTRSIVLILLGFVIVVVVVAVLVGRAV